MIILHHLENSRSQRILWLLEELEVDYKIKEYQRDKKTYLAPKELERLHPLGKSPIIEDTSNGRIVAESGLIIEYLIDSYGKQFLAEGEAKWDMKYWLHFAEGSLMPQLVMSLVFNKIKNSKMPFFIKPIAKGIANKVTKEFIRPNLNKQFAMIENALTGKSWFVGESLSAADFQMSFPLEAGVARGMVTKEKYPNIVDYVKRIQSRRAYQQSLEKTDRYDYLIAS